MKVICSYCRKDMEQKEPLDDDRISHAMCLECYDYFKEQIEGLPLEKYLDKFETPILIMDADCRIVAANKMAENLTGRSLREVVGLLGGEALECAYARLPGGCGKTVHCETCTIRMIVKDIIESGKAKFRVPVKINGMNGEFDVKISVLKIGKLIRMMIEN